MEFLLEYLDIILHIDLHLGGLFEHYDAWIYFILAAVIFCETGLVVTPFLPGDSLLFAVGTLAGAGLMNPWLSFILLLLAAICGDNVNYWLGRRMGTAVFVRETSRLLNKRHLFHAQVFYGHHGGKTIIIARFVPIVRTFAPFVAGISRMRYSHFLFYSLSGGLLWVGGFIAAGYFFGNLPAVRENFGLVVSAIIIVSALPAVVEIITTRRHQSKQ